MGNKTMKFTYYLKEMKILIEKNNHMNSLTFILALVIDFWSLAQLKMISRLILVELFWGFASFFLKFCLCLFPEEIQPLNESLL
jgi:hypothetical protein